MKAKRICLFLYVLLASIYTYAQATIDINDFKIMPGETKEISIDMNNLVEIRALQVQVVFPEGITLASRPTIVNARQGQTVDEFGEVVHAVKTLSYNKWEDGSYMIVVNADDGIPFSGNEGAVITMKVKADESIELGNSSIVLQDIELAYKDGETSVRPQNENCNVTVYQMLEVIVSSNGHGTVTGGGFYELRSNVSLTAIPDEGYQFDKWSDNSTDNPYTFTLTESKELIATFVSKSYELIYMVDGVEFNKTSVDFGSAITALETPTKEGYTFSGWSEIPETMPAKDVTITGTFSVNSYNLVYMVDGVEFNKTSIEYGSTITVMEAPTREGYTFSGWSEVPSTMPAKDVTITGTFTANSYKVTYILDGEVFKTEQVTYGTVIPTPEVPAKEGYNFSGWGEVPATMPAKELTFTGSYTINKDLKYNLVYIVNGVEYKRVSVAFGDAVVLEEAPTKEGHTFSGWSEIPETMPANDVTITGSFSVNSYSLVYMVDGAEFNKTSVEFGSAIAALEVPTKEGYTFSGWSEVPSTMPAKDVTITGTFSVNSYNLVYMVDGVEYNRTSVEFGSTITALEAPAKEGYTFNGWSEIPSTMPAKDVSIMGTFSVNSYNLVYMVDGVEFNKTSVEFGSAITALEAPTKEGYTFSGWSEIPSTMPASNVTITGTFTANSYKVTYILDGEVFKTEQVTYGTVIPTPEVPAKEGYNFSGWGEVPVTMPAKELTFTGSYTINKDLKYNLVYMVDGVEYKRVSVAFGDAVALEEAPTKEGHTFSGWSEVPETMPLHDVMVTGTFTANSYTLTYVLDGETFHTESVVFGTFITAPEVPAKEGHTFSGWTDVPATMPANNVTITGTFTANSYKVTYILDGEVFKNEQVTYGTVIPTPEVPAKEGYTFSGWGEVPATMPAKELTFTGSYTINKNFKFNLIYLVDSVEYKYVTITFGDTIVLDEIPTKEGHTFSGWSEVPETMPLHDVMVTGTFTANSYALTYVLDGEIFHTENVVFGTSITAPETPTKEGHTFSGWSEIPETMPAKDVTIEGTFSVNSYKVTYILDGEVFKTEQVTYGTVIPTPEVPAKEGYNFSGWGEVPATMPAKELTFTGSYTINKDLKYNLVYIVNGVEYKRVSVAFGDAIILEEAPTKEGHTFSGWSDVPETMPLHDVMVKGTFTANSYTLTYVLDGETFHTETVVFGTAITAPEAPTKEGYTFSGWSEVPSTMPAKDVTVTGVYTVNQYTLTYLVDGAEYKKVTLDYASAITAEAEPTKEGHTFSGWSEIPTTMPAKDMVITGTFTANKYAVVYTLDGEAFRTDSVTYGTTIVLADAPAKEGHTFAGWSEVPAAMPAKDVTVTGTYTVNQYTLTYLVDGEVYATEQIAYGSAIILKDAPVKEGYIFSGWSDAPETMPAADVVIEGTFTVDGIEAVVTNRLVDVYTLQGVMVKRQIPVEDLEQELPTGIYIVHGKKMVIK